MKRAHTHTHTHTWTNWNSHCLGPLSQRRGVPTTRPPPVLVPPRQMAKERNKCYESITAPPSSNPLIYIWRPGGERATPEHRSTQKGFCRCHGNLAATVRISWLRNLFRLFNNHRFSPPLVNARGHYFFSPRDNGSHKEVSFWGGAIQIKWNWIERLIWS